MAGATRGHPLRGLLSGVALLLAVVVGRWLAKPVLAGYYLEWASVCAARSHEAIALCEKSISEYPYILEAYHKAAYIHYLAGEFDEALRVLEKGVGVAPEYWQSQLLLAQVHMRKAEVAAGEIFKHVGERALPLREAMGVVPLTGVMDRYPEVRQELARASAAIRVALEFNPVGAKVLETAAEVHVQNGRIDEAITLMEKLAVGGEESALYLLKLASLYGYAGKVEDAIAAYERFLSLHPEDSLIEAQVGNLFMELDRPEDAAGYYRRALEHDPYSVDVMYLLSVALERVGDVEGAIDILERALDIYPEFEPALERLERLMKF